VHDLTVTVDWFRNYFTCSGSCGSFWCTRIVLGAVIAHQLYYTYIPYIRIVQRYLLWSALIFVLFLMAIMSNWVGNSYPSLIIFILWLNLHIVKLGYEGSTQNYLVVFKHKKIFCKCLSIFSLWYIIM